MLICRNQYVKNPPTGSVLGKATKLITLAVKESRANKGKDSYTFWERVMPSNVANKPKWMTFDDAWVDEVRRGLKACYVFMFMPIYWLSVSQQLLFPRLQFTKTCFSTLK
jgi:proton-dependent oligopeptide transporter, POT family